MRSPFVEGRYYDFQATGAVNDVVGFCMLISCRRHNGLAMIRRQLIAMLVKYTSYRGDCSLAFRWRGLGNLANSRTLTEGAFDLVMHGAAKEIKGRFPDQFGK
jgi:hypothetical protein